MRSIQPCPSLDCSLKPTVFQSQYNVLIATSLIGDRQQHYVICSRRLFFCAGENDGLMRGRKKIRTVSNFTIYSSPTLDILRLRCNFSPSKYPTEGLQKSIAYFYVRSIHRVMQEDSQLEYHDPWPPNPHPPLPPPHEYRPFARGSHQQGWPERSARS